MITKVHIRGFRCFKEFVFEPDAKMNVIVGGNEAGKSTILEAISMALTGRVNGGRWVGDLLNPYWFNKGIVDDFFSALEAGAKPIPPEFRIDIYLRVERGDVEKMRGIHNMDKQDSVGITLHALPDEDYAQEFKAYLAAENCPRVLPIEYYRIDWHDFALTPLHRKPKDLNIAVIDSQTIRSERALDYYTKQLLEQRIDERTRTGISVQHRKMRSQLGQELLTDLNLSLAQESESMRGPVVGIQIDQSRAASWESTLVPGLDAIPFSLSGQGEQAIAKTVLAMNQTALKSNYVLVEEPENHLSHTRLRVLLKLINELAAGRQVFITTHSSYVLNRLGIEQLALLSSEGVRKLTDLDGTTTAYFRKLSGFDTLRILLADRMVLVEGPSDEILFNRFFADKYGREPLDMGVDVMSISGTSFRRGFELAALLDKRMVAIRDNDGKETDDIRANLKDYLSDGRRELYVGDPGRGTSLEPQLIHANGENLIRKVLGVSGGKNLTKWMTRHKTDAALALAESEECLIPPKYIEDAINAIMDDTLAGS
jgi:predicted ATPase